VILSQAALTGALQRLAHPAVVNLLMIVRHPHGGLTPDLR
jgi:hypothetical protein